MNLFKKFDDILTSPWALWGISVVVAVFMWFSVTDTGEAVNARRTLLVRLEYRELDPQFIAKGTVELVEVAVEAPEEVMSRLGDDLYEQVLCEVNLRARTAGKYRENIRAVAPQNVTVVSVTPSVTDVELIRQVGRVFPVEVVLPQDMPAGRYLEAVEIVPKELNVKGTERDLAKIGSLTLSPTLSELETARNLLLPIRIVQSEPFEDGVVLEPSQARLNATLVTGLPRKKVPVNVRLSGAPSPDYAVRFVVTDPAEVMVQGSQAQLDALTAVDTETVNIAGIAGNQTMQVPLLPFKEGGPSMPDVNSVRLSIQLEQIKAQRQIAGVPVLLEENGETSERLRERWRLDPAAVAVTIEAPPSRMELLDLEELQLRAYVDVSGIFLRSVTLPVRTVVSGDFSVVKIEPPTITASVAE